MYDETVPMIILLKIVKTILDGLMLIIILTKWMNEMINFLKNCEILSIREIFKKEKVFNIVLDNYSVHLAALY